MYFNYKLSGMSAIVIGPTTLVDVAIAIHNTIFSTEETKDNCCPINNL